MNDSELARMVRTLNRFAKLHANVKAKAHWEQLGVVAVLREWPSFVDEYLAALAAGEEGT